MCSKNIIRQPITKGERYEAWIDLNYRCVPYKKKYGVAYLSTVKEIIICEFVSSKMLQG
jgi:hypothetical protein